MGVLKKLFLFLVIFVILPTIASVALLKFTATPLVNWILSQRVNAPAEVQKVNVNWSLTQLVLEKLLIENPKGFPKGPMLSLDRAKVDISPETYLSLKPYLKVEVENFYLHFIRNSDNSTNLAVAFGFPYTREKVSPLEFKLKEVNAKVSVNTLKNVKYEATGKFVGFANNAPFEIKGEGDLSNSTYPKTVTDFIVYNWRIENNPILNNLAQILNRPDLKNLNLAKIEGRVATEGPWVIFKDRNTKAYLLNDKLFAEVLKGSKYNRETKELDIKLALYLPARIDLEIYGTTESPKAKLLNPMQVHNLIKTFMGQSQQTQNETEKKTTPQEEAPTKVLNQVKEQIQKPLQEIKEKLQGLENLFH